jgi:hypothetical protein
MQIPLLASSKTQEVYKVTRNVMEEHVTKQPPVFRYLSQEYIDDFFRSGKLRLSAFTEFAKHADEQRCDTEEGWLIVDIPIPNKGQALRSRAGIGRDAHILSVSLRGDPELMRVFGTNGYFKINDVEGFGLAVASKIPDCRGLISGNCTYVDDREIRREMGVMAEKAVEKSPEGKMYIQRVAGLIQQALFPHALFWKLTKHAHQQEFRFIWQVSHEVHEPLFIECPEVVHFCERIV